MTTITRRRFLQLAAVTAAALGLGAVPVAEVPEPETDGNQVFIDADGVTWSIAYDSACEMADSDTAWFRINGGEWRRLDLPDMLERNFIEGDTMLIPIGMIGEVQAL